MVVLDAMSPLNLLATPREKMHSARDNDEHAESAREHYNENDVDVRSEVKPAQLFSIATPNRGGEEDGEQGAILVEPYFSPAERARFSP